MIRVRKESLFKCNGTFHADMCQCLKCAYPSECLPTKTGAVVQEAIICDRDEGSITYLRDYAPVLKCECRSVPTPR